jgi:hypothetical protein
MGHLLEEYCDRKSSPWMKRKISELAYCQECWTHWHPHSVVSLGEETWGWSFSKRWKRCRCRGSRRRVAHGGSKGRRLGRGCDGGADGGQDLLLGCSFRGGLLNNATLAEGVVLLGGVMLELVGGLAPVLVDHLGELFKSVGGGCQVPREAVDHLSLRQIDISEVIRALSNNSPTLSKSRIS